MIRINGYLHRDEFCDVIRRWMYNQPHPSDARTITHLIHFNTNYTARYLKIFSDALFGLLYGSPCACRPALYKRDLKDFIVCNPPQMNPRIEDLICQYRLYPERYFRETPFEGQLYYVLQQQREVFVGGNRHKRVRRLAEKSARRLIDHIFEVIKRRADELATARANRLGIERKYLITKPEDMQAEFYRAEERVVEDIRRKRPLDIGRDLAINDVAGVKVILEDSQYKRLLACIDKIDSCRVLEEERHVGKYNAINLLLSYSPPKEEILGQPLCARTLDVLTRRGLEPRRAHEEFARFVRQGEDEVFIEIIVSNYQEMLESEIGRCMHEERVSDQRWKQEYRGDLAKNVEYLMLFMFNFALSPRREVGELPIKLWHRYLPDTFDDLIRKMFDIPPLRLLDDPP